MDGNDLVAVIKKADSENLKLFLNKNPQPSMESEILKVAFPDFKMSKADALALYKYHFALFHLLYKMQDEYLMNGKYLHIHFMRTALFDIPKHGACRYFDEELMCFCTIPTEDGVPACENHKPYFDDTAIDLLSEKYFYLDPQNFDLLDEETANKFMDGAWELMKNNNIIADSYAVLGLEYGSGAKDVKLKFRELAKDCHPDIAKAGDSEKFIEINRAYKVLINLLEKF